MQKVWDVIVVGSGNAALCAAIAAKEKGRDVLVIEKARPELAGGNSKYTAGAMRFAYNTKGEFCLCCRTPAIQDYRARISEAIRPISSRMISSASTMAVL